MTLNLTVVGSLILYGQLYCSMLIHILESIPSSSFKANEENFNKHFIVFHSPATFLSLG
jgi:hypothetical protein